MGLASNISFTPKNTNKWSFQTTFADDTDEIVDSNVIKDSQVLDITAALSRGFIAIILILYKHLSKLFDLERHLSFQDVPSPFYANPQLV